MPAGGMNCLTRAKSDVSQVAGTPNASNSSAANKYRPLEGLHSLEFVLGQGIRPLAADQVLREVGSSDKLKMADLASLAGY